MLLIIKSIIILFIKSKAQQPITLKILLECGIIK